MIINLVPELEEKFGKSQQQLRPRKAINFLKIAQEGEKIRKIALEVSFEKLQKSLQRKNHRGQKVFLLPNCKSGRIMAEMIRNNIRGSKIVFVKTKKHR
jgi:hypothetical protein